jgi:hypothetical protein
MTTLSISDVIGDISQYKFNPAAIQRASLRALNQVYDGTINVVDATNPFIFMLECTAMNTSIFLDHNQSTTRRLYPAAAVTEEDLYYHMSDKDYINRFAKPTTAKFKLLFLVRELLDAMVLDSATNVKKVTIPRNTVIEVAGIPFSLQYPIDICQYAHGGIQVLYNVNQTSPLQTLTTNLISFDTLTTADNVTYIRFEVEATQFRVETMFNDVSTAGGFTTEIAITDSYYHARVYAQDTDGKWIEMVTTHTLQVYDPTIPTAVLQVYSHLVKVTVPVVYTMSGLVKGKIRIDIYETKGNLNLNLKNYKINNYFANWYNIDTKENDVFNVAIRNVKTVVIYSETVLGGGRNALSFTELRTRVLNNAIGPQSLPITNVQLETKLADMGYEVSKNVDTITNRVYLASKSLPLPTSDKLLTGATSAMPSVLMSLRQAALAHGAFSNQSRVTLSSQALYQNTSGVTKIVSQTQYESLMQLSVAELCKTISQGSYFYSPFTYVLDASSSTFTLRPYYLDAPVADIKNFISENATTGFQVSIAPSYNIKKTTVGYEFYIQTSSTDSFRNLNDNDIRVQMSFNSINQADPVFLTGIQVAKDKMSHERTFKFILTSSFDIDSSNRLELTSFTNKNNALPVMANLTQEFNVYFITTAPVATGYIGSQIDSAIDKTAFKDNLVPVGLSHETVKIQFGITLDKLWARSRSVVGSAPYKVHESDVPAVYKNDVYEVDPVTGTYFNFDPNGQIHYLLKHKKGDPVLAADGSPLIEHHQGEPVYDDSGNPVLADDYERYMVRILDILLIDGTYFFANDSVVNDYRNYVIKSMIAWISDELNYYDSNTLDQTQIFYHPKVNTGIVSILDSDNQKISINAAQSMKVTLYVTPKVYSDDKLRSALTSATIRAIDNQFQNAQVGLSSIVEALKEKYGSDVIDVEVSGLGGSLDLSVLTVLDASNRLSIKKKLTSLSDNAMIVEEDIDVQFKVHGTLI